MVGNEGVAVIRLGHGPVLRTAEGVGDEDMIADVGSASFGVPAVVGLDIVSDGGDFPRAVHSLLDLVEDLIGVDGVEIGHQDDGEVLRVVHLDPFLDQLHRLQSGLRSKAKVGRHEEKPLTGSLHPEFGPLDRPGVLVVPAHALDLGSRACPETSVPK